jgi:enoyl-[acyl-carrier protein] reductase III
MSKGWAVILGASSGFGAATATALATEGHPIFGVHLDLRATRARADAVRDDVARLGVPVSFYNGNAASAERRAEALDQLELAAAGAPVSVLVHSLAFGSLRPFIGPPRERIGQKHLDMTLSVMAHSLLYWVQDLLDRGLLADGARVFAMTSSGSLVAMPSYGAVSAAKAALESHVRQLAVELAPRQITVNALMAGVTHTPALERIPDWERLAEVGRQRNPHGRLTTPEDVARCVVALTSPGTAWMTGNVIRVDGGETLTV